ncbi:MAG: citrate synthase [Deltaproteobacteria bacterium]|nr:citrate synthase [Deltaproteobacteria bacterium]
MSTTQSPNASASGLEGVVVADTLASDVDGARGRLVIAGHDVETLAFTHTFAQTAALLWRRPEEGLERALGEARARAFALLPRLGDALGAPDGMDALRASTAHLGADFDGPEALTGALAVLASAWARLRRGERPVAPDPSLGHARDYLRMARGRDPSEPEARALDTYLVTVSDHGLNASTFTARVVTSTGSDGVSAVVAALGALKGPLHGGAPGPVLSMLDAIGEPDGAVPWLEAELARGRRIMGLGHRIYRVRDPRAAVFERAVEALEAHGVATGRLPLARAVERAAVGILRERHPSRALHANVEFYTAVLLDSLGLDREAFTPTFAVGRVAGWWAHILEQRAVGRLIRPASRYVGPGGASPSPAP